MAGWPFAAGIWFLKGAFFCSCENVYCLGFAPLRCPSGLNSFSAGLCPSLARTWSWPGVPRGQCLAITWTSDGRHGSGFGRGLAVGRGVRAEGLSHEGSHVSAVFSVVFREAAGSLPAGWGGGCGEPGCGCSGRGSPCSGRLSLGSAFLSLPPACGGVTRPAGGCSCFVGGSLLSSAGIWGVAGLGERLLLLLYLPARPPGPLLRHLQVLRLPDSVTKTCFSLVPPAGGWSPACSVR